MNLGSTFEMNNILHVAHQKEAKGEIHRLKLSYSFPVAD